ncbi:hypothetical protein AADR41_14405 [Streptomyces sp. CLV115]|uniref:hypothetical protein n=1 Tax=Streptomyces sp. CLV115 TaxID=3138502 RepID=UPI00313AE886
MVAVLNDVVATEVVCRLRYTRHAISATGIDRAQVVAEFTEHAAEEMQPSKKSKACTSTAGRASAARGGAADLDALLAGGDRAGAGTRSRWPSCPPSR